MADTTTDRTATIAGYAHVNLCVTDTERALEFYVGQLGLSVLPRPDFGTFGGAWLRLGDVQLHLSEVAEMPDFKNTAPHLALYIPTADFERSIDALAAAGVDVGAGVRSREDFGATVLTAFCKDPDGNLIELTDVAPF